MGVPKRKPSKMRLRTRRASHRWRWRAPNLTACAQCGTRKLPHTACPSCGYYRGLQVITVEVPS